jgi:hypothetical protein
MVARKGVHHVHAVRKMMCASALREFESTSCVLHLLLTAASLATDAP